MPSNRHGGGEGWYGEGRDTVVGCSSSATSGCLILIEKLSGTLAMVGCKNMTMCSLSAHQDSPNACFSLSLMVELVLCLSPSQTIFVRTSFGRTTFGRTAFAAPNLSKSF